MGAETSREVLTKHLQCKPGSTASPVTAPGGGASIAVMHKVMGKLFAIVSSSTAAYVILKCDPHLIDVLKETYAGIGHRTHLDRRNWISVDLDTDVPADEIIHLVDQSYDLVCATLTRKQRAELAASLDTRAPSAGDTSDDMTEPRL